MSLRRDVVPAVCALGGRPGLLWVGLAVGVLQVVVWVAARTVVGIAGPPGGNLIPTFVANVAVLFTLPLYAGVYVPIARPPADARETLAVAARAVKRRYLSLLAADLLATVVAVAIALVVGLLWLVASTGVRYVRYALADPGFPHTLEPFRLALVSLFLGLWLGGLCVRFADVFVLFGDASPWSAWQASVRFARLRPLSALGFGVAVSALHVAPVLVALLAEGFLGDGIAAAVLEVAVVTALAGVAVAFSASLQAVYFDRTVAPAVEHAQKSTVLSGGVRQVRVVLAVAILIAAVGGAVFVRAADVRDVDRERAALPDDPAAAYDVAASNVVESNHRRVVYMKNVSDPNATLSVLRRSGIDYRDRQLYHYLLLTPSGRPAAIYFSDGTFASLNSGSQWSGLLALLAYRAGNWSVLPGPGYALFSRNFVSTARVPTADDVNWSVVSRNASTLVLRVDDPTTVRELLSNGYVGMGGNMTNDSYLTAYVDRDRAVIQKVAFRLHSRDTGNDYRYVVHFEEVGTADLRRPPALGPRRPLEWAWDVLYY